jgi:hypothetical protein
MGELPLKRSSRRTLLVAAGLALVVGLVALGRLAGPQPTTRRVRPAAAPSVVKLDVAGPVDEWRKVLDPVTLDLIAVSQHWEEDWQRRRLSVASATPPARTTATGRSRQASHGATIDLGRRLPSLCRAVIAFQGCPD